MEIEPNLTVGEVCPDASPMRHAETGDAPNPRETKVYNLARPDAHQQRRKEREAEAIEPGDNAPLSSHLHVRSYSPPNWFTSSGVLKKRREIEAKGLPSFEKWRFTTLTVDPERFGHDPLAAYLHCRDRLRHFFVKMRDAGLMNEGGKWCWKLEFQENGWPHWHVLHDRTAKYSEAQLAEIDRLWGFGMTQTEMVRQDDFAYSFKYAFKPVQSVEDSDLFEYEPAVAPSWFLDFVGSREVKLADGTVVEKPVTFAKVRFWQTSKGFYTTEQPKREVVKKDPVKSMVPQPVRQIANRLASTVQVVARKSSGRYVASAIIALSCFTGTLWTFAGWDTLHGAAVGLGVNSYVIPANRIEQHTHQKWTLKTLRQINRLSLAKAQRLAREGNNLRTC